MEPFILTRVFKLMLKSSSILRTVIPLYLATLLILSATPDDLYIIEHHQLYKMTKYRKIDINA